MERNDVKIIKKKNFHSGKFFFYLECSAGR